MHRKPKRSLQTIHAFRFPYHTSVPLSVQELIRSIQVTSREFISQLRLFVTFCPAQNLRRRLHKCMLDTLDLWGKEEDSETQALLMGLGRVDE